ncbi:hypothetical protein PISMIDRAFT_680417 [Pisolithus microcarpus 441]|uniref:Uncharacterized protein n=1 Tax=Pisolithus microcarpus 441 TaxID=765257 RepID=A0A0C9Z034_9AGAM|nr:hypothetical protein PISMIDRAFT_680417 [Pisolithus microcarpus 441]
MCLSNRKYCTFGWPALDDDTKTIIKQEVSVTLASSLSKASGFSVQVVAASSIELPHNP